MQVLSEGIVSEDSVTASGACQSVRTVGLQNPVAFGTPVVNRGDVDSESEGGGGRELLCGQDLVEFLARRDFQPSTCVRSGHRKEASPVT